MNPSPAPIDEPQTADETEQLAALKQLLFADEQDAIKELREEVGEALDPENIGRALPAAIRAANRKDGRLAASMGPLIGDAIQSSIKKDPQSIVDAISPIMGPAIRDAIRQAIRGMVQSLNKTLEYSVSWQGLRWRWEAFTTGKPFAEVVLLHTLLYRVDQVFLIHRESGLSISHAILDGAATDVDLASGMLTAIQDFVRDSFGATEDESLETMEVGDHTVWVETGPRALLAAVVEGEAPSSVRVALRECLEDIHIQFASELDEYQGDGGPLSAVQPLLAECLGIETEADTAEKSRASWVARLAWSLVAIGLLVGAGYLVWQWRQRATMREVAQLVDPPPSVELSLQDGTLRASGHAPHAWLTSVPKIAVRHPRVAAVDLASVTDEDAGWMEYVAHARNAPGLLVTRAERIGNRYVLEGFRDPLADDPTPDWESYGLDPQHVDVMWRPYCSLDRDLLMDRIRRVVQPTEEAEVRFEGGTVIVSGKAPAAWIDMLRMQVETMSMGEIVLDTTRLNEVNHVQYGELRGRIEGTVIYFDEGQETIELGSDATLNTLITDLVQFFDAAGTLEKAVRVTIIGYAAEAEAGKDARRLSQARAREVWMRLRDAGVATDDLVIQGLGAVKLLHKNVTTTTEKGNRCCLFDVRP